jgi:secreted trypsin-like serine protease
MPDHLMAVELSHVSKDQCAAAYKNPITPAMMCGSDPGQNHCNGDSGGPLMDADNNNIQVGVVSFVSTDSCLTSPAVFARISDQWTWIRDTICNNHSHPKPNFCTLAMPSTPKRKNKVKNKAGKRSEI